MRCARAFSSVCFLRGRQIRQEALAEKFAVSRVPVREALRQLEAEGLIQTELQKGAFVSSLSLPEVIEMLDIRIGLELFALKLAVPNFTKEHAKEAERILKRYDGSESPREWRDLNLAFHLALYKRVQPSAAGQDDRGCRPRDSSISQQLHFRHSRTRTTAEHHRVLELCVAGSTSSALRLLEAVR
jgi:DNA-binding GntR family transcriptional regulator